MFVAFSGVGIDDVGARVVNAHCSRLRAPLRSDGFRRARATRSSITSSAICKRRAQLADNFGWYAVEGNPRTLRAQRRTPAPISLPPQR